MQNETKPVVCLLGRACHSHGAPELRHMRTLGLECATFDSQVSSNIGVLLGETLTSVEQEGESLVFLTENGDIYMQRHESDCCETVVLEDICGDLDDLVGSPVLVVEAVPSRLPSEEVQTARKASGYERTMDNDSETWVFYKLATFKGYVTLRWYGVSNGYYCEEAQFFKVGDRRAYEG